MEDKLRLNTNLYGFEGIIGRRDYVVNITIIVSIALLFTLPYYTWIFMNMQTLKDVFNFQTMFIKAPLLLQIFIMTGTIGTFVLSASNIWRRLNDINGKVNVYSNVFILFLFFVYNLSFALPFLISFLLGTVCIILGFIIIFKRGKVTGTYPYDVTKEFNWGAYFGTWIWGLFNKSYNTLWMLLLWATPWGSFYQLYCGLKGNEWALKNKKWNDTTAFNNSQKRQSIIFTILSLIITPIISLIITLSVANFIIVSTEMKEQIEAVEETKVKVESVADKLPSIWFESYSITPEENKFYVLPSEWKTYSFGDKVNILDIAAQTSAKQRRKEYQKQHPDGFEYFSETSELPRTKIYSSETKRLLGEYYFDETAFKKGSFKDILKAGMNAYRFYNE